MYSEVYRPTFLREIIGHADAKKSLETYLTSNTFKKCIFLTGPPGIGKTTMVLSAARTFNFEPLEINASKSIRSFDDVEKIKDACRSSISINSLLCGERSKRKCVILDEIDGSDPHAQSKIVAWIKDSSRCVPILCTGNDIPTVFKRNIEHIEIIRCFPPRAIDLQCLFPDIDITAALKECQHDVRRLCNFVQYGKSDTLPKFNVPPTGLPIEKMFVLRQEMFRLPDPFREYHACKRDNVRSIETK
jgi:hypothetical protein